jgi:hypothetical protein
MNLERYEYTPGDRGGSSVGQSSGLIIRRSLVQVQPAPPENVLVRGHVSAPLGLFPRDLPRVCPAVVTRNRTGTANSDTNGQGVLETRLGFVGSLGHVAMGSGHGCVQDLQESHSFYLGSQGARSLRGERGKRAGIDR